MTVGLVRGFLIGKRGAAHLSKNWWLKHIPNISKDLIGVHGTTIDGEPGDWGRFNIAPGKSKDFVTKHNLYLLEVAHVATAVDYALGWANSSTGNRDDCEPRTGRPALICVTETDETKVQRQFGNVIVIPKGTKCTATVLPICENLQKDVDRAHIGHRLGLALIARGLELAGIISDPVPQNKPECDRAISDLESQNKWDKPPLDE